MTTHPRECHLIERRQHLNFIKGNPAQARIRSVRIYPLRWCSIFLHIMKASSDSSDSSESSSSSSSQESAKATKPKSSSKSKEKSAKKTFSSSSSSSSSESDSDLNTQIKDILAAKKPVPSGTPQYIIIWYSQISHGHCQINPIPVPLALALNLVRCQAMHEMRIYPKLEITRRRIQWFCLTKGEIG